MKKIFRQLHLWLSVPFGLIIAIICFSGAMLVFETEITSLILSNQLKVEPNGRTPLSFSEIVPAVQASLPDSVQLTSINVPASPTDVWRASLSQPRRAQLIVDQYSGELRGMYQRLPFFSTMFGLHRWLLMAPTGKTIVGVSVLIFVIILITGIVVWCPRNKKALINSLKIDASHGWHRLWHGLHVAGGMYALVLLLALSLTGLTWSFPWYRTAFYTMLGVPESEMQMNHGGGDKAKNGNANMQGEKAGRAHGQNRNHTAEATADTTQQHANFEHSSSNDKEQSWRKHGENGGERTEGHRGGRGRHSKYTSWDKAFANVAAKYPDGYSVINMQSGKINVSLGGFGNQRASDSYTFDERTGEITGQTLYADANRATKVRGWIFSVHVGSWGGIVVRILTFLAALFGASLPLTGYYLWIKRLLAKHK